jgi:hypothetical protein
MINPELLSSIKKKEYVRTSLRDKPILTNAYLKDSCIDGNVLTKKGNAYVYQNGRIVFDKDDIQMRPWS